MHKEKQFKTRFPAMLVICALLLISSGCASLSSKKEIFRFNSIYSQGEYDKAAKFALDNGGSKTGNSNLLTKLQAAGSLRNAKQYSQSTKLFNESENAIKYYNEKSSVPGMITSVLLNDNFSDYRGEEYDGIMLNTYKALNFWALGKRDKARVEFNRAIDRQRRAKERFAKDIAKLNKEIAKKQAREDKKAARGGGGAGVNFDEKVGELLEDRYSNLDTFKAYPDFINPFTTYMAGLFFMSEKDYPKASTLLKKAYGMVDKNKFVAQDFAKVENILDGKGSQDKAVWVIFENGLGPVKMESRLEFPVPTPSGVMTVKLALPELMLREQAYPYIYVNGKNASKDEGTKTEPLASMERVIQTEFEKDYKGILTRAVISSIIKTTAQYYATKKYGAKAWIISYLFQAATTSADIRIWTGLPKDFQIAKIKCPKDGLVTIATPKNGNKIEVKVPANESSLIYVKIPQEGSNISYSVLKL